MPISFDGLSIIVDDGGNDVLTASCRDALASWGRAGGVLVVFLHTGAYTLDGSRPALAGALGLSFEARPAKPHKTFNVGKGPVVVLPRMPSEHRPTRTALVRPRCGAGRGDPSTSQQRLLLRGRENSLGRVQQVAKTRRRILPRVDTGCGRGSPSRSRCDCQTELQIHKR